MPGWRKASFDRPPVSIEARPKSRWRKGPLHLLPYIYGNKPLFILKITANGNIYQATQLYWFLRFSSGDITGHPIPLPVMKKDEMILKEAGDRLLGFTGDTVLGIKPHPDYPAYHTVYHFRVMAVEDLLRDVFIVILGALIAFFLGSL